MLKNKKILKAIIFISVIIFIFICFIFIRFILINKQQNKLKCEEGYTPTLEPATLTPSYYCKINKEWKDFKPCNTQDDCPNNLQCVSPDKETTEFRCVPIENYHLDCEYFPGDDYGYCY